MTYDELTVVQQRLYDRVAEAADASGGDRYLLLVAEVAAPVDKAAVAECPEFGGPGAGAEFLR